MTIFLELAVMSYLGVVFSFHLGVECWEKIKKLRMKVICLCFEVRQLSR